MNPFAYVRQKFQNRTGDGAPYRLAFIIKIIYPLTCQHVSMGSLNQLYYETNGTLMLQSTNRI